VIISTPARAARSQQRWQKQKQKQMPHSVGVDGSGR